MEPYKARGEVVYKAVCKDDTKAGICPKVNRNDYANCDAECNSGNLDVQCNIGLSIFWLCANDFNMQH